MFRTPRLTGKDRPDTRLQLRLEPLEQRLLLDGNVLVGIVGGNLVIIGDDADNGIDMWREDSVIAVRGTEGTYINGSYEGTFYAPLPFNNINISMNAGSDDVDIDEMGFGGSLNYDGGPGNDRFRFRESGLLGSLNVMSGFGEDKVWISDSFVRGNTSINTGFEEDGVTVYDSGFGGNLSVVSGNQYLGAQFMNIGVRGNMLVDGGQGDLETRIGSEFDPGATIGGSLTIRSDDQMYVEVGHTGVRNGIAVMTGRWDAEVYMLDVGTTNLNIQTQTALPGESPRLKVALDEIGLVGNLNIVAADGFRGYIDVTDTGLRGNLNILWQNLDGATGDVDLYNVTAGGNVQTTSNAGELRMEMMYVASGGSVGVQGNFLTSVQAQYIAARGNFNVDFGPGLLEFGLDEAVLGGSLNVSGAGGIEFMEISDSRMRGNANVDTGDGSVQAYLGNLVVGGSMNLTNGTGAIASYGAEGVRIRGNLNLTSNALFTGAELIVAVGGNVNIQTGLGGDELSLAYSAVRGSTTIRTDGGNDLVVLFNSLLNGSVLVNTAGGEDYVSLAGPEANGGDGPLQFNSSVTVLTGTDDDTVRIGWTGGTGQTAIFNGPLSLNGDGGFDTLDVEPGVNTFTQAPSVVSFENII